MTIDPETGRDSEIDYTDQSWQIAALPPVYDHAIAQELMGVQDDPDALYALAVQLGVINS